MSSRTLPELDRHLDAIRDTPADAGRIDMLVRRPAQGEREELEQAALDAEVGLVGDTWQARPSSAMPDGSPHPEKQLTLINIRAVEAFAGERDRWALAGDQIYVDLDLSEENLPPGTRVQVGTAVVELTAPPHTGCAKFAQRFGKEALRWVNTPLGRSLRLRGANARVIEPGVVRCGDEARKL
ncbi:MAG: MOSC domain-containing protein [Planctomycetota bacterium]